MGGAALSAAFSADGKWVATGSADNTARIHLCNVHKVRKREPETVSFSSHRGDVFRVVFAPGGDLVATASPETTAYVWDLKGRLVAKLSGHRDRVTFIDFNPKGDRIVTTSADMMVRIWDREGTLLKDLTGHAGIVRTAQFSPDGKRLVSSSEDETARIWQLEGEDGSSLELKGHAAAVISARYSPDGQQVLTASEDKTARIWSSAGGPARVILKGHKRAVTSARFSPDGQHVLTASTDRTARLWSLDGKEQHVFFDHPAAVASARFSPDGKKIVTVSADTVYLRHREASGAWKATVIKGHTAKVNDARFSPDGKRLLTTGFDGRVRSWSLEVTWKQLMTDMHKHTTICLSPLERMTYLAEDLEGEAIPRAKECEKSYGRTGVHEAVKQGESRQVRVSLTVQPEDAMIKLDDEPATPGILLLEPDTSHSLVVSGKGYITQRSTFTVTPELKLSIALREASAPTHRPVAPAPAAEPAVPTPTTPDPSKQATGAKPPAPKDPAPAPKTEPPKPKEPKKAVYFEDEL